MYADQNAAWRKHRLTNTCNSLHNLTRKLSRTRFELRGNIFLVTRRQYTWSISIWTQRGVLRGNLIHIIRGCERVFQTLNYKIINCNQEGTFRDTKTGSKYCKVIKVEDDFNHPPARNPQGIKSKRMEEELRHTIQLKNLKPILINKAWHMTCSYKLQPVATYSEKP